MAFLAVLRGGFETAVSLLAAFQASGNALGAGIGAALGIVIDIGDGIYRGGIRLNMGRYFTATGFVLVLVAAGLVMTAMHTGFEAGWIGDLDPDIDARVNDSTPGSTMSPTRARGPACTASRRRPGPTTHVPG